MFPDLVVRPMTAADLPAVLAIQARCYTALVPESAESFLAKLAASPATCHVATVADQAVAYLVALPWEAARLPRLDARECTLPATPDCLYLHDLAVAPAARGSGAGRALVATFLARRRELGLARACLVAVQDSQAYWEGHGFRVETPAPGLQARLASYGDDVRFMAWQPREPSP